MNKDSNENITTSLLEVLSKIPPQEVSYLFIFPFLRTSKEYRKQLLSLIYVAGYYASWSQSNTRVRWLSRARNYVEMNRPAYARRLTEGTPGIRNADGSWLVDWPTSCSSNEKVQVSCFPA